MVRIFFVMDPVQTSTDASKLRRNRLLPCRRQKNGIKKQPQRGLGVAQLEKLRLQEQHNRHQQATLSPMDHMRSTQGPGLPMLHRQMQVPCNSFPRLDSRNMGSVHPSPLLELGTESASRLKELSSFQIYPADQTSKRPRLEFWIRPKNSQEFCDQYTSNVAGTQPVMLATLVEKDGPSPETIKTNIPASDVEIERSDFLTLGLSSSSTGNNITKHLSPGDVSLDLNLRLSI